VRALLLLLLFSCGSGEKGNSDGGSSGEPADAAADKTSCMLDAECAAGQACTGAQPGVAGSGHCTQKRDPGIAAECIAP